MDMLLRYYLHPCFHTELKAHMSGELEKMLEEEDLHSQAVNQLLHRIAAEAVRRLNCSELDSAKGLGASMDTSSGLVLSAADKPEDTVVVPLFFAALACCTLDGSLPSSSSSSSSKSHSALWFEGVIVVAGGRSAYGCPQQYVPGAVWILVVRGVELTFKQVIANFEAHGAIRSDLTEAYDLSMLDTLGHGATASVMHAVRRNDELDVSIDGALEKTTYAAKVLQNPQNIAPVQSEIAHLVVLQKHPNIVGFFGAFRVDEISPIGGKPEEEADKDRSARDTLESDQNRSAKNTLNTIEDLFDGSPTPRISSSWVLMLELCSAGDVFEDLKRRGPYSVTTSIELIHGVFVGLDHIHLSGIVHRDIKPENILLAPCRGGSFRAVITDFGIAAFIQDWEKMSKRCGTPGYTAPELLAGEVYGTKVDIFSAGAVFYRMLSNSSPFCGADLVTVLRRTRRCVVRFPAERWSHIPPEVHQCLTHLMAKNPRHRPSASQAQAEVLSLTALSFDSEQIDRTPSKRSTHSMFWESMKRTTTGSTALPRDSGRGGDSSEFFMCAPGERLTDHSQRSRERSTVGSSRHEDRNTCDFERPSLPACCDEDPCKHDDTFLRRSFADMFDVAEEPRQPQPPAGPPTNMGLIRSRMRKFKNIRSSKQEAEGRPAPEFSHEACSTQRAQQQPAHHRAMQPVPPQTPPSSRSSKARRCRKVVSFPGKELADNFSQMTNGSFGAQHAASSTSSRTYAKALIGSDEENGRISEATSCERETERSEQFTERTTVETEGSGASFSAMWPFGGNDRGMAFGTFSSALSSVRRPRLAPSFSRKHAKGRSSS